MKAIPCNTASVSIYSQVISCNSCIWAVSGIENECPRASMFTWQSCSPLILICEVWPSAVFQTHSTKTMVCEMFLAIRLPELSEGLFCGWLRKRSNSPELTTYTPQINYSVMVSRVPIYNDKYTALDGSKEAFPVLSHFELLQIIHLFVCKIFNRSNYFYLLVSN